VADAIHQLLVVETALDKLGARSISIAEAEQLLRNRHAIVRNVRGHPNRAQREGRRLIIGTTDGGRVLSLIVEATIDPTTWLLITGWEATDSERRLVQDR